MAAIPHEEQINLVVANLPFCRADLLGSLEGTSYYYWFAAKEGFLKKCAEQVLNRLSAQGDLFSAMHLPAGLTNLKKLRTVPMFELRYTPMRSQRVDLSADGLLSFGSSEWSID